MKTKWSLASGLEIIPETKEESLLIHWLSIYRPVTRGMWELSSFDKRTRENADKKPSSPAIGLTIFFEEVKGLYDSSTSTKTDTSSTPSTPTCQCTPHYPKKVQMIEVAKGKWECPECGSTMGPSRLHSLHRKVKESE